MLDAPRVDVGGKGVDGMHSVEGMPNGTGVASALGDVGLDDMLKIFKRCHLTAFLREKIRWSFHGYPHCEAGQDEERPL